MNDVTVMNPFESSRAVAETSAGRAQQTRESTEVLALLYGARQNPRDPLKACDRIRNAFTRAGLAEVSQYTYQRGGTDIAGPSIRSAEALRLEWTNMAAGWREVSRYVGHDGVGVSEVEAYAVDYETTNREAITFHVRHWRDTKTGGYRLKDERDIFELCANQAQRRKRACILALIPGDVVEMAMDQASATLKAKADTSPEGIAKMLDAFAPFGVTKEHVEKRIQRRIDAIQAAQFVALKRIFASLRDGMSSPADWFDMGTPDGQGATSGSAAETLAQRRTEKQRAAASKADKTAAPPPPLAEFIEKLKAAKDADAVALVLDSARGVLSEADLEALTNAAAELKEKGDA